MSVKLDTTKKPPAELETRLFKSQAEWMAWLEHHNTTSPGLWLRFAKKAAQLQSLTLAEAVDGALCYGWIDSQKKTYDSESYLVKFTPRGRKSIWSKINREKVALLIESGQMQSAGLQEVDRAKEDGRWAAAYDSAKTIQIPDDFQTELDRNPAAHEFFATLNGANRYAILFRIQTAKKAETRVRRIQKFIDMLEKREKIYP